MRVRGYFACADCGNPLDGRDLRSEAFARYNVLLCRTCFEDLDAEDLSDLRNMSAAMADLAARPANHDALKAILFLAAVAGALAGLVAFFMEGA